MAGDTVFRLPLTGEVNLTVYFEDMEIGDKLVIGSYTFRAEEIKAFAGKFDPQSFHLDEEAAKQGLFGRLCASGRHTASVWMKLMVTYYYADPRNAWPRFGPSPGFRDMKWIKPVYVDDTITYTSRVISKRNLASKPGWGLMESLN